MRPTSVLCAVVLAASIAAVPAAAQDQTLTLRDISTDLASVFQRTRQRDFVAEANIRYGQVSNGTYDRFFRESAIAYGGFFVGRSQVDEATIQLRNYARTKMAVAELDSQIVAIRGDTPPESLSAEQSMAILRTADAQGQLSDEEREYMVATAARVAATLPVVQRAAESSRELSAQAPGLVSGARSAFGLRRAGSVAGSVRRSAGQIQDIPTEAVGVIEALTVLSRGLAMMNNR